MKTCRGAFADALLALARENPEVFAVTTDSRGSALLGDFAQALPAQFVECGIAEQDAVGIAAGLANAGLKPFVCGPACFYSMRSAEQIKVDVCYSHMNVKIIGVSGGVSYGALGATHHAVQDAALMRTLPNLTVILPADAQQTARMARALFESPEPAYVRVGRGAVEDIYPADAPFEIGRANILREGGDVALIACGEMVAPALKAEALLRREGVRALVIDMHTLRPLDEAAALRAAATGAVVTIEEHCVCGGLGSAVAEYLSQRQPTRMRILGLPNEVLYNGDSAAVFARYDLTPEGICQAARGLLR